MSNKKRILLVNEASYLNSGLGKIGRAILTGLKEKGYEVAELAGGVSWEYTTDWKVYPVLPNKDDTKGIEMYQNYPLAKYGSAKFERVCLDFRPDIVLNINDPHASEFITVSPFRKMYRSVIMPTIDSLPLQASWHSSLLRADQILFYSQWAKNNSGLDGEVVYFPVSDEFYPINKETMRLVYGVPDNVKLIGSIFKNQPRKQVGTMFDTLKRLVDKDSNIKLHIHTQFPPRGQEWDIVDMIEQYGLEHSIYLSYICLACDTAQLSHYQGQCKFCANCGKRTAYLLNEKIKVSDSLLNEIMNCYDLYAQFSNAEGACVPIAEALMCDIPVACPNGTAMKDYSDNFNTLNLLYDEFYHMGWKSKRMDIDSFAASVYILDFLKDNDLPQRKPTREDASLLYSKKAFIDRLVNVIENQPNPELSWDIDQRTLEPKTTDIELQSLYEYMHYVDSNSEYENCVFIKQFTDDPMNLGPPAFGTTTKHYLQQLNNYIKSFNKIEEIRCQEQNITIE